MFEGNIVKFLEIVEEDSSWEELWSRYGRVSIPGTVEADSQTLGAVEELKTIKALKEALDRAEKRAKAKILAAMREKDTLTHNGRVLLTWRMVQPRDVVDTTYLRRQWPEVYNQVIRPSDATRRLTIKP